MRRAFHLGAALLLLTSVTAFTFAAFSLLVGQWLGAGVFALMGVVTEATRLYTLWRLARSSADEVA